MAISTINGKLAVMELEDVWEPGLPLAPGALGQDDQQQFLWGFPEILWGEAEPEPEPEPTPAASTGTPLSTSLLPGAERATGVQDGGSRFAPYQNHPDWLELLEEALGERVKAKAGALTLRFTLHAPTIRTPKKAAKKAAPKPASKPAPAITGCAVRPAALALTLSASLHAPAVSGGCVAALTEPLSLTHSLAFPDEAVRAGDLYLSQRMIEEAVFLMGGDLTRLRH